MTTLAAGASASVSLPAGQSLVFQDGATGLAVLSRLGLTEKIAGAAILGPFPADQTVSVACTRGTLLFSTQSPGQVGWQIINDTAYTLKATDRKLAFVSGSAIAVTVPAGLPASYECSILQEGAGQITFAAGAGATLTNASAQLKSSAQGAVVAVIAASGANASILTGSTAA